MSEGGVLEGVLAGLIVGPILSLNGAAMAELAEQIVGVARIVGLVQTDMLGLFSGGWPKHRGTPGMKCNDRRRWNGRPPINAEKQPSAALGAEATE